MSFTPPRRTGKTSRGCCASPSRASIRSSIGERARRSPSTPATSACCRRAPPRPCARCRSAIASSRASPAGRIYGRTSWSLRSLIGLSVEGLTSFSVAPLRLASLLGILLAAGALVFSVWILIETFVYEHTVPGYPSIIIGIMVIGGVQLLMIGVMGEYIGKVLSEIKHRPVYFVAEHTVKRAQDKSSPADETARNAAE